MNGFERLARRKEFDAVANGEKEQGRRNNQRPAEFQGFDVVERGDELDPDVSAVNFRLEQGRYAEVI